MLIKKLNTYYTSASIQSKPNYNLNFYNTYVIPN